jgi:2-isopropylmalate synthase
MVGDRLCFDAAEGHGPVNALDAALRKTLGDVYPSLSEMRLVDYKVRVVDSGLRHGGIDPGEHRKQR